MVRRSFEALDRVFDAYWANPRSIAAGVEANDLPEWSEAFEYIHPDIEWQTVFLGETFHGVSEGARAWDDFLTWAEDYRPEVERPLLRRVHHARRGDPPAGRVRHSQRGTGGCSAP